MGPLIATALVAAVGNAAEFKHGRELAAYLGLVPRHRATGGRTIMLGISKRGGRYLRSLLIHGARAALWTIERDAINAVPGPDGSNSGGAPMSRRWR